MAFHVRQSPFYVWLAVVLSVICASSIASGSPYHIRSKLPWNGTLDKNTKELTNSKQWDFLTLSLSWPQTFCTLEGDENVTCQIPPDVNDLAIHGLWPSGKSDPFSCNNTWKFNVTEIKDLKPKLLVEWPNVLPDRPEDSLWQHEWEKHGTCAASLPALNSQHSYFEKTLELKEKYNLLEMLRSYDIVPSDSKQYQYDDVFNSLAKALRTQPYLECYIPLQNPDVFYIAEMRICLDKQFGLIDCTKSSMMELRSNRVTQRENQPCTTKLPLMIPPIQH
ncbi:ribonuclease Oy-like [Amphiura filiformis]|uniref:ribonuclease Oy-like n=1 Tax=Amphiura filiformis TaxID=82378 RepID=UPI003B2163FF